MLTKQPGHEGAGTREKEIQRRSLLFCVFLYPIKAWTSVENWNQIAKHLCSKAKNLAWLFFKKIKWTKSKVWGVESRVWEIKTSMTWATQRCDSSNQRIPWGAHEEAAGWEHKHWSGLWGGENKHWSSGLTEQEGSVQAARWTYHTRLWEQTRGKQNLTTIQLQNLVHPILFTFTNFLF